MATEWMTYAELGERIGVSPEAARQRAMRLKLRRQIGNDGKARVAVDLEEVPLNPRKRPLNRCRTPVRTSHLNTPLVIACTIRCASK